MHIFIYMKKWIFLYLEIFLISRNRFLDIKIRILDIKKKFFSVYKTNPYFTLAAPSEKPCRSKRRIRMAVNYKSSEVLCSIDIVGTSQWTKYCVFAINSGVARRRIVGGTNFFPEKWKAKKKKKKKSHGGV